MNEEATPELNPAPEETPSENQESTQQKPKNNLSGVEKAALLLISVGETKAAEIMKHLDEKELEEIAVEIAKKNEVKGNEIGSTVEEFFQSMQAKDYISKGGLDYAKKALEEAWGHKKAEEIIQKAEAATKVSAFYLLQTVDDKQLQNFLQNEHPQTVALILANINPKKAATILSELPEDQQTEISYRLATMEKTSPELINDIESALREQMGSVFGQEVSKMGGSEAVAEILNSASRSAEKTILSDIKEKDPKLAEDIKSNMFLFEDIEKLADSAVQRINKETDSQSIALALKGATPSLKKKFLKNMSKRAADMLEDELQYLGPVRVREVENAQKGIIDVIRNLEESGEIRLNREDEEIIE
ncbi:MAG TPA: flagellar motor switch protein FliG [bacterium]|nr:flagellar motor switch protein FliG [bacterium]